MDPQIPVPPPGTDSLTPAMYGAIGYVLLAFGHWAAKNGLPFLQQAFGFVNARDKELAATAKEGPIMVLEEVKRQLVEAKQTHEETVDEMNAKLDQMLCELKDVRAQHFDCEKKHAALQAEVQFLRRDVNKIQGQQ